MVLCLYAAAIVHTHYSFSRIVLALDSNLTHYFVKFNMPDWPTKTN